MLICRLDAVARLLWSSLIVSAVVLGAMAGACAARASPATGRFIHVAPDGRATNDGTASSPLDLATALDGQRVRPGDTVWLRRGKYLGNYTSALTGTPTAPIVVRQYPGERATIDANTPNRQAPALQVNGADTWYWGFEVTDSNPERVNTARFDRPPLRTTLVNVFGPRTRFINLVVHDGLNGFGVWSAAIDAELHGNIIYNVGVEAPDRGHGHSIYVQNETGTKRIANNILFNSFSYGIHAYTEGGRIDDIELRANTAFEHGVLSRVSGRQANVLIGGGDVADRPKIIGNLLYMGDAPSRGAHVDYGNGCNSPVVRDNYIVAATPIQVSNCTDVTMEGNTFVGGAVPAQHPRNTYSTGRPAGLRTFVLPNAYERGRANVTIFNWDRQASVTVALDATGLRPGERFEIRDAQDYFKEPVVRGTYGDAPVALPMTGLTAAPPTGNVPFVPPHTPAEFGVFVVLGEASGVSN